MRSAIRSRRDGHEPSRLEWVEPVPATEDPEEYRLFTEDVEQGLRDIDFPEVTAEDRATFIQAAVGWQVRRALACGRFDLALRLQRYGSERAARLYERPEPWRPILLFGAPAEPPDGQERRGSGS